MIASPPSSLENETIVALASASGRAGVAVVRVSGPRAGSVFSVLCRPAATPASRRATLRDIVDPVTQELIDHALVLWFPSPHSFTGEDVVELHLHGGRAIVSAALEVLCRLEGFALAGAGAFSRRAFDNGKMDLTEAEAIADLVDAETAAQRRQALRQMDGALGQLYHGWAESLTQSLAYSEAEIDFADEDIPAELTQSRRAIVLDVMAAMERHLADNHRGERLREGFTVALLGAPNAGKSSLLNALARREAAIVSPIAGTTRDVIEVDLDLGGYPVCLIDTAGLRESADEIESEGVRRALSRAQHADLKILLFDGSAAQPFDAATMALADGDALVVVNKSDREPPSSFPRPVAPKLRSSVGGKRESSAERLRGERVLCATDEAQTACAALPLRQGKLDFCFALSPAARAARRGRGKDEKREDSLLISAKTGEGLEALTARLIQEIESRFKASETPALTRLRHREAVEKSLAFLRRAMVAREAELVAEDLRLAVRALGRITGRVDVEDLLTIIFSSFCVGK